MPGLWETEDTEADPQRKLIFVARDAHPGESGVLAGPAEPLRERRSPV
jgi:hypothetical protein